MNGSRVHSRENNKTRSKKSLLKKGRSNPKIQRESQPNIYSKKSLTRASRSRNKSIINE